MSPSINYFFGFLAGEDWKATWKNRLEKAGQAWTKKWTEHQTYDDYWKHGCICEDYDRIKIPILAIGGWHDMYSNAVFRMVEKMPNCRYVLLIKIDFTVRYTRQIAPLTPPKLYVHSEPIYFRGIIGSLVL